MPEAEQVETWGEDTFRVRGRIFAMGRTRGRTISIKASLDDQAGLIAMDPETFQVAAYTGRFGWVNVHLPGIDRALAERLIRNAWERTAPRRMSAFSGTRRGARTPGGEPPARRRAGR